MGYVPPVKTYRIDVSDGEHAGLSMTLSGVPVGAYLDMLDLEGKTITGDTEAMRAMLVDFADHIIEWNLETPTGTPIPATVDGLRSLSFDFALVLCGHWLSAMGTVEPPETPPGDIDETDLPMDIHAPALTVTG